MGYDQFMLALCLWREARGRSREELVAILKVIFNRRNDPGYRWPRDLVKVILQPKQFSSFNVGDPNATKFPVPPNAGTWASPDWKAWELCMDVVEQHNVNPPSDLTFGANHYESFPPGVTLPQWAAPDKMTTTLGPFRFYKL